MSNLPKELWLKILKNLNGRQIAIMATKFPGARNALRTNRNLQNKYHRARYTASIPYLNLATHMRNYHPEELAYRIMKMRQNAKRKRNAVNN